MSSFFWYSPSRLTLQGSGSANYSLSAGASYSMLDDKLSFRLNFSNLVLPPKPGNIVFGDNFHSSSYYNWARRSFSLGISYKINDYKESMRRMDEEGGGGGGAPQGGGGGGV